jgi:hypothetical protein
VQLVACEPFCSALVSQASFHGGELAAGGFGGRRQPIFTFSKVQENPPISRFAAALLC